MISFLKNFIPNTFVFTPDKWHTITTQHTHPRNMTSQTFIISYIPRRIETQQKTHQQARWWRNFSLEKCRGLDTEMYESLFGQVYNCECGCVLCSSGATYIYIFSFLFFSMVLKVGQIGLSALFPSPACQCTPPNVWNCHFLF